MKLIILKILLLISSIFLLPSGDIWNKIFQNIQEKKIVYKPTHFIFDEDNYTGLDIYGDKMRQLYNIQESIFINYLLIFLQLNILMNL